MALTSTTDSFNRTWLPVGDSNRVQSYLVWGHHRSANEQRRNFSLAKNAEAIFENIPDNIFIVKFKYRFTL